MKSVAFTLDGKQVASAALPNAYVSVPGGGAEQDMKRTWVDAAETLRLLGEKIPGLADRVLGLVGDRAGRRHVADRQGRRTGGAGVAVARRARCLDCRGICALARACGALQANRHRRECLPDEHATRLDEAAPSGGAGARRNVLPLQGLALFQADRSASHRSFGSQFHVRRISHAKLCATYSR